MIKFGHIYQISSLYHQVHHLSHVSPMKLIMVRHVTSISLIDLIQENNQFLIVYRHLARLISLLRQIANHFVDAHREKVLLADLGADLKSIEVK